MGCVASSVDKCGCLVHHVVFLHDADELVKLVQVRVEEVCPRVTVCMHRTFDLRHRVHW